MEDQRPADEASLEIPEPAQVPAARNGGFACDRCGDTMIEFQCKIVCLNCGHRFDCSDLNIYFD